MKDVRIAAAQFEARDADKQFNLGRIEELARRAVEKGAEIVDGKSVRLTNEPQNP